MAKSTKLDQIPLTYLPTSDSETQFHQKLQFWEALNITFQKIYSLFGLRKIFPLTLVMMSL